MNAHAPFCQIVILNVNYQAAGKYSRIIMDSLVQQYNLRLRKIWLEFQTRRNDNFAIILDPLLKDIQLSEWDIGSISRVDCFHPSVVVHEKAAIGLWNNLMKPSYLKRGLRQRESVECPRSWDRIWTI